MEIFCRNYKVDVLFLIVILQSNLVCSCNIAGSEKVAVSFEQKRSHKLVGYSPHEVFHRGVLFKLVSESVVWLYS